MTIRMLIDGRHREETRVAVVKGNRIEEFDFERTITEQKKQALEAANVICPANVRTSRISGDLVAFSRHFRVVLNDNLCSAKDGPPGQLFLLVDGWI